MGPSSERALFPVVILRSKPLGHRGQIGITFPTTHPQLFSHTYAIHCRSLGHSPQGSHHRLRQKATTSKPQDCATSGEAPRTLIHSQLAHTTPSNGGRSASEAEQQREAGLAWRSSRGQVVVGHALREQRLSREQGADHWR